MQHQYWVTKRTVLKKLGSKEDDCIVSSDAELDAKLELFRSISDSCMLLQRVIDQYQERLCILSQEENALGKFLRDAGKNSGSSGKYMIAAGKAISYSGQQRHSLRSPLLRLYHEVETFRARAVSDMRSTVTSMEKARNAYRAALSWMKAASAQLDPDTGRGVHKFRKAQGQVRESKRVFDKLTLDVLQKIDLLAAARCNMFSHVLMTYQSSFTTYTSKVAQTLVATSKSMTGIPQYDFCILKELSQGPQSQDLVDNKEKDVIGADKDQALFFQDEYKDDTKSNNTKEVINKNQSQNMTTNDLNMSSNVNKEETASMTNLLDAAWDMLDTAKPDPNLNSDLVGISLDRENIFSNVGTFMPSQLLQNCSTTDFTNAPKPSTLEESSSSRQNETASNVEQKSPAAPMKKQELQKKDMSSWFKLFAELDPLANPDALMGLNTSQSHAA